MKPSFKDFPLELVNPSFDSDLVDVVNELEVLRNLQLQGDVHPHLFMQLKTIFHMLESLGSARIEGNHTTLTDYVEQRLDNNNGKTTEQIDEIRNIERAMHYIDSAMESEKEITEHFIRELHTITVQGLKQEGDRTPGQYRKCSVMIAQSAHLPPEAWRVPVYMEELVAFINRKDKPKYDLMKIALAHHRFGWIHPFSNGNGRTVRLLTYALLIKYGFNVQHSGRILNPTAVFCNDRNLYYEKLGKADSGQPEGLEEWCTYVLSGISQELRKIDQLTKSSYLMEKILDPAITFALHRQSITKEEAIILSYAAKQGEIKAGNLGQLFPNWTASQRTYQVGKLVDKKFIFPIGEGARIYVPNFANSYLLRGVIDSLSKQEFIGNLN